MDKKKVSVSLAAPMEIATRHYSEPYTPGKFRTEFQRDRDRILYSKEFRRLSGKTQVFLAQTHDHLRTRLTHTLEVAQISRVIGSYLRLDPVLCESIALGHDVGHTPFGHVGERTLNFLMNNCDSIASFQEKMEDSDKGFKHNLQSLRVTCDLEQSYDRSGLNLTNFTLWGIQNHSSSKWKSCSHQDKNEPPNCHLNRSPLACKENGSVKVDFYDSYNSWIKLQESDDPAWSFEGLVVELADEIAQRHHDIEDAYFVKIIPPKELVEKIYYFLGNFFDPEDQMIYYDLTKSIDNKGHFVQLVSKLIIGLLTKKLIYNSTLKMNEFIRKKKINNKTVFKKNYRNINFENEIKGIIGYSNELALADSKLQKFLSARVLNSIEVQRMDGKGSYIIRRIFKAYLNNPRQLHDSTIYSTFRQNDKTIPNYDNISKEDIGRMRNDICSPSYRSDTQFQICLLRVICDHVAGMTDNFALKEHKRLYA